MTAEEFFECYVSVSDEGAEGDDAFEALFAFLHPREEHWTQVVFGSAPDDVGEVKKLLVLVKHNLEACGDWLPLTLVRLTFASRHHYTKEWDSLLAALRNKYEETDAVLLGLW